MRQVKTGKTWQHITVSNAMVESTYLSNKTSEIDYLFPLYLYNENANGDAYKTENVKPAFRRWIDNYYGKKLSPENIIGYIYAVLHSPDYRRRYADSYAWISLVCRLSKILRNLIAWLKLATN